MTKRFFAPPAVALLLAAALAAPQSLRAAGFSLTCQVLDPTTQAVRGTFAAGDEMLVRLGIEVPPEAADKQVNVKLSAIARIAGIAIPYSLDEINTSVPNRNPNPGGTGPVPPSSGSRSESHLVVVPRDFPAGTYSVRAKAAIEGVGKRACEAQVVVTPAAS